MLLGASAFLVYDPAFDWGVRLTAAIGLSFVAGIIPASILAGVPLHAGSPDLVGTTSGMTLQGSQVGQFIGPYLVDTDYMGRSDLRHGPCFTHKTLGHLFLGGQLRQQDLDGHLALKFLVPAAINPAHTPFAQNAPHLEAANE